MGRIGKRVFKIGRSLGIRCKESGVLYLGFEDDKEGYADNLGQFEVHVVVFEPVGKIRTPGKAESPKKPRAHK